jgi:hypothetical protein
MTLGNMRAQGVRSLSVSCWLCRRGAVLAVDRWSDGAPVPSFGPRMVFTGCGIVGAFARPNWQERSERDPDRRAVGEALCCLSAYLPRRTPKVWT